MLAELPDTLEQRLAALRLVPPEHAVVSGPTAAWLHGVDVRAEGELTVHVFLPSQRRIRARPGLVVAEARLDPADVMLVDGVRVATPVRTAYDCARTLPLVEGVVVADALAHVQLLTVEQLAACVASHRRARGVRRVDEVVVLAQPKSESPMETRLRLVVVFGGLPRPEAQITLYDDLGWFVARIDLGWRDAKIAIEYDGAHHGGSVGL